MMEAPIEHPILVKSRSSDLIVAGYASLEMVDKQGDLITKAVEELIATGEIRFDKAKEIVDRHLG